MSKPLLTSKDMLEIISILDPKVLAPKISHELAEKVIGVLREVQSIQIQIKARRRKSGMKNIVVEER